MTLNENSGWMDSRTGKEPGMWDFVGMLANLKNIKIRGGYVGRLQKKRVPCIGRRRRHAQRAAAAVPVLVSTASTRAFFRWCAARGQHMAVSHVCTPVCARA